ncbi:MAG: FkbM family methyltransferase [Ignavibacterium sp.]|nr:FkbM family methyltransferase [Ignavibacterium sp.]
MKKVINHLLSHFGYKITKLPSLDKDISEGKYKWLQEFGIKSVLDVGGNNGEYVLFFNNILPTSTIYSFEPIKDVFQQLQNNTGHLKNAIAFNFALGDFDGEADIYRNNFTPSSSFLKIAESHINSFPQTANTTLQKVQVKKIDSIFESLSLKKKVMLKLDVQGYELSTLKGAENALALVDLIITEVSYLKLYENQVMFNQINNYLYEKGFVFAGNLNQLYDPIDNRILQADAIYIKH